MFENAYLKLHNKLYLVLSFILIIFVLSFMFLLNKINVLTQAMVALNASNEDLIIKNESLHNLVVSQDIANLQKHVLDTALPVVTQGTQMSDAYKIFLILVLLGAGSYAVWYACWYVKFGIFSLFSQTPFGGGNFFNLISKSKELKSFQCVDKLNNLLTINLNEKTSSCDILIKPFNSSETITLDKFFEKSPELFAKLADKTNELVVTNVLSANPPVAVDPAAVSVALESLKYFF